MGFFSPRVWPRRSLAAHCCSRLIEGVRENCPDGVPAALNVPLGERSGAAPGVAGDRGVEGWRPLLEDGVRLGVRAAAGMPASSASSLAPRVSPPQVSPATTAPPPKPIRAAMPVRSRMIGSSIAGATMADALGREWISVGRSSQLQGEGTTGCCRGASLASVNRR